MPVGSRECFFEMAFRLEDAGTIEHGVLGLWTGIDDEHPPTPRSHLIYVFEKLC